MIEKYLSGDSEEFKLINNKKEGKAVYCDKKGNREEYTYVNGIKQGKAVYYDKKGNIREYTYINGLKEGKAIIYYKNGDGEERYYIEGKLQGKAIYYFSNGDKEEYTYVNGLKEGKAVTYYKKGNREEYTYINGIKERESIVYHTNEVTEEKNIDIKNKEIDLEVNPLKNKTKEKKQFENIILTKNNKKKIKHKNKHKEKYEERGNIIEKVNTEYYKEGSLKERRIDYSYFSKLPESKQLFLEDESFIKDITFRVQEYKLNGKLSSVSYHNFNFEKESYFENLLITYDENEKIIFAEINFKKKRIKYYYKNGRLEKIIESVRGRDSKIKYYDETGKVKIVNIELDEEDEEENGGFFGRIFSGLGMILSEKISDIDFKETLININDTLDKYKK